MQDSFRGHQASGEKVPTAASSLLTPASRPPESDRWSRARILPPVPTGQSRDPRVSPTTGVRMLRPCSRTAIDDEDQDERH